MLTHTDSSYEVVLSRIEKMYKSILKDRELKKIVGNELALMVKRIGKNENEQEVVINFAIQNGLIAVLKRASKEMGLRLEVKEAE